jgi:membrane-bound lytic murein transglycosylase D
MLKRKLNKVGIVSASLLFMAAASRSKPIIDFQNESVLTDCRVNLYDSTTVRSHAFDSSGLCVCLAELSESQLANAPRIHLNSNALNFVKEHQKKNRIGLEKLRITGSRQFAIIEKVFHKYGLPVELKYLAVVESKLNTKASSGVGAKGMWQFMPVSAKQFGLKINDKYDERTNAYSSTVAAAKCLSYLHDLFDDWLLTVAAYNCGPGNINKAIRKSGSRDFWVLQQYLPLETRNHVKKFISTHYFFEGHGSLITLTKAESKAHIAAVIAYVDKVDKLASL